MPLVLFLKIVKLDMLVVVFVKSFSKSQFNSPQKKMFELEYLKTLKNDLEKIVFKKYPQLKKIKKFLSDMPSNIFT